MGVPSDISLVSLMCGIGISPSTGITQTAYAGSSVTLPNGGCGQTFMTIHELYMLGLRVGLPPTMSVDELRVEPKGNIVYYSSTQVGYLSVYSRTLWETMQLRQPYRDRVCRVHCNKPEWKAWAQAHDHT